MSHETIEVVSPGLLTTVQDLGRPGWAHLGISVSGACDAWALRLGNQLVGNDRDAAALEMTLSGGTFRFHREAWIAITGGECVLKIDGQPIAMWTSIRIHPAQVLQVGTVAVGARVYLCVYGGLDVPLVLGSRSTLIESSWGGYEGRVLQSGDRLDVFEQGAGCPGARRAGLLVRAIYKNIFEIRVTEGPQWNWFGEDAHHAFFENAFSVTNEMSRRGVRLDGPKLNLIRNEELVTEGIAAGSIQIPTSGMPIILLNDQRTTGGYAKIATVIHADLFMIGQLRPGAQVKFRRVTLEEAWTANQERERQMNVRRSIFPI